MIELILFKDFQSVVDKYYPVGNITMYSFFKPLKNISSNDFMTILFCFLKKCSLEWLCFSFETCLNVSLVFFFRLEYNQILYCVNSVLFSIIPINILILYYERKVTFGEWRNMLILMWFEVFSVIRMTLFFL